MTSTAPTILVERPANNLVAARLKARGLDDLLARIYAARGVTDIREVRGGYEDLLPWSSMKNVAEMASYLADCVVQQRRVLIVSDYDCDGAAACSILHMAFGGVGMNHGYMVPDRMVHGYGLTPAIVDEAAALEPRPEVIITVDNGISSHAGVERARELGIEVLVTDHHLAPEVLPNARLIVNPNQPGCQFESKNIAGCGVAWYVARALVEEMRDRGMDPGFCPSELLSYVALGTVADVVKLDRNNRILVSEGLKLIRQGHCAPGVLALAQVAGKNPEVLSCADIGFGIGPRINAAGRLAHMGSGIRCLTTLDQNEAADLARSLHETNEERKEIQKEMVEQAFLQAKRLATAAINKSGSDRWGLRSIVVYDSDWHEGVVGIVAGRLKEDLHRPTIVMTDAHDGDIKGSARSIPGFHLKHALDELHVRYPGILKKFGGHAMAAGMTIDGSRLGEFIEAFEVICREHLTEDLMTKKLVHDGALPERHFTLETVRALSQEVWGQGFEEPVFVNTLDIDEAKVIGQDKTHLKLIARVGDVQVDAMAFGKADLVPGLSPRMTIAFKAQVNAFRGEERLQLLVEALPESLNPELAAHLGQRSEESAETESTPLLPEVESKSGFARRRSAAPR